MRKKEERQSRQDPFSKKKRDIIRKWSQLSEILL